MTNLLQRILPTVQKPARYTGGEYNQVLKPLEQVDVRIAFCFPDTYELGMSNLGMRILYGVMNEMEGVWCQRVFAPWGDMEAAMEAHRLPLWALESQDPVRDFDMIAFTIGYEMSYSNVVNMLRLSQVPIYSRDRQGLRNLVFAGGVCAFNPEPLADFVDFFSLGEGEESTVEIVSLYQKAKREDWTKDRFLEAVSHIPGVYVPSFYTGRHSGRHHPPGGSAQGGNQANCGGSGPGLLPHQNHRTHHRNCPRPEQPGGVPGVHPGLPVLSGRLLLPPGAEEKSGGAVPAGCGEPCRFRQPRADPGQSVHLRLPGTEGAH